MGLCLVGGSLNSVCSTGLKIISNERPMLRAHVISLDPLHALSNKEFSCQRSLAHSHGSTLQNLLGSCLECLRTREEGSDSA